MQAARRGGSGDAAAPPRRGACRAPRSNLYLFANGDVGPCCRNRSLGNVSESSLIEIWRGSRRQHLARRLDRSDFPLECATCELEHRVEGHESSFTTQFEQLSAGGADGGWPGRIEFELSNTCNLQCVQCNGELSSAIRARREHRPPMRRAYGESFFEELPLFLEHLESATFVGGEPFLTPECYRVWDLVAQHAPDLSPVVVTNGTQWGPRVEAVLEQVPVRPYVSLDGITAETFERIRRGASFDRVMANIERFRAAAERAGTEMSIVFCVMQQNVHELPDLLRFAEQQGIFVTTSIVREPAHHSVANLAEPELRSILSGLESNDAELATVLELNRAVWNSELERVRSWHRSASAGGANPASARLLMFDRAGAGRVDGSAVATSLDAAHGAHRQLVVGADGRIVDGADVAEVFGLERVSLDSEPLAALQSVMTSFDVVSQGPDHYEAVFDSERGGGVLVAVPERDDRGWADSVRVFIRLERRSGPRS